MKRLSLVLTVTTLLAASTANAGWWRTFGGPEKDGGICVQQTSDGGYIVTGFTYSFSTIPSKAERWVFKLDSLGHSQWSKTYGEGSAGSIRQTSDGGYIFAGGDTIFKINSSGEIQWSRGYGAAVACIQELKGGGYVVTGTKLGGEHGEFWLLKVNMAGDSLWSREYTKGNAGSGASFVEETSDGGFIITGLMVDSTFQNEAPIYKATLWLVKTNASGDTSWTRTYGGEIWDAFDIGRCVRQTKDGDFIITGSRRSSLWLLKTDAQGDTIWGKVYEGAGYCVEQTVDGGYIITGPTDPVTASASVLDLTFEDVPTPQSGDLELIKTNENGDTVWIRIYGGAETDAGRYVQQTDDNGYIVVGYTYSFGAGWQDLYLLKTDSLGLLGVVEQPISKETEDWQVITPIGSKVAIRYTNAPQGFQASVFDVSGRKVADIHSSSSAGVLTWGEGFTPAVYFIRVENLNQLTTAKIVIVH